MLGLRSLIYYQNGMDIDDVTNQYCSSYKYQKVCDQKNKTKRRFPDNNDEIFKNPDIYLEPIELIRKVGYPCEIHTITTTDGYILSLFRIPFGKNHEESGEEKTHAIRPVVLMSHGILMSGYSWLLNSEKNVLAYQLANRGFDCWILNARGSEYSNTHSTLETNSREYWNFSWHEMAQYDMPVVVDYILQTSKNKSLNYIGFSMGCTMLFAAASLHPELAKKIKLMIALAPGVYMSHARSIPIKVTRMPGIEKCLSSIYHGQFPLYSILQMVKDCVPWTKNPERWASWIALQVTRLIGGTDTDQINWPFLPLLGSHGGSTTSVKCYTHFGQLHQSGEFRQFDNGRTGNLEKYDQEVPPLYDLSKNTFPVGIYYSENDACVEPQDALKLADELPHVVVCQRVDLAKWTHFDFIWAKDSDKYLNDYVIECISSYNPSLNFDT